ncbi:MAG: hypothetical protein M1816_008248 [Peltula sp. TS41687]|nr:MAG: hypothetical protein M1816_008248 [Peltula sp. TS41687]
MSSQYSTSWLQDEAISQFNELITLTKFDERLQLQQARNNVKALALQESQSESVNQVMEKLVRFLSNYLKFGRSVGNNWSPNIPYEPPDSKSQADEVTAYVRTLKVLTDEHEPRPTVDM